MSNHTKFTPPLGKFIYRKRAVSDGYRARCLPAWLQKQPDSVKRACWQLLAQRNPTSVRIANRAKEVQL